MTGFTGTVVAISTSENIGQVWREAKLKDVQACPLSICCGGSCRRWPPFQPQLGRTPLRDGQPGLCTSNLKHRSYAFLQQCTAFLLEKHAHLYYLRGYRYSFGTVMSSSPQQLRFFMVLEDFRALQLALGPGLNPEIVLGSSTTCESP